MGQLVDPPFLPGFPAPAAKNVGGVICEGPVIASYPMPGQWLLKKARREFGWQVQKAAFQSGSVVVPSGDPLMEIEYEVRIWQSAGMSAFIGMVTSSGMITCGCVGISAGRMPVA